MSKTIVVINGSPRTGWNTDLLVTEAGRGVEDAGAEIIRFDLYKLEKYTGCMSCFGCKREKTLGKCIWQDGLTPVLEAIREADGLIIGTPNYLGNISAGFRALYERLIFQYITYKKEVRSYNDRKIPVFLIMDSNAPDTSYRELMDSYGKTFESFIGPVKILLSGETLQVIDYAPFNWTAFNEEQRRERRETVFPEELKKAYETGREMVGTA